VLRVFRIVQKEESDHTCELIDLVTTLRYGGNVELGLKSRTAIITGASGGIGREIALSYAAESADVVITYRNSPVEAERVATEIEATGGRALVTRFDLGTPESATHLVAAVLDWTGRIDVLVNNALHPFEVRQPDTPLEAVPDEDWIPRVRDNVEGAIRLSRLVAPIMRRQRWGRLVHISSSLVAEGVFTVDGGEVGAEYYAAAKAALHGFSRAAAFNLGRDGDILSNVLVPGLTRTARNRDLVDDGLNAGGPYASRSAIRRVLDAAEVAKVVTFLGSAANTGITGAVIPVTGGA
jgi:3-oxoacyl-[acyl-carrier protein] reductase